MTLLILSGTVGVGKTTVGAELSTLLEARGVPHTFIDLDALAYTFPRPADDPFASRLALANLVCVWDNCREAGSKDLIVSRIVETREAADRLAEAVSLTPSIVCELHASPDVLLGRVARREVGSNLEWHERRTLDLADSLSRSDIADLHVDTDARSVTDVAREIDGNIDWSGEP